MYTDNTTTDSIDKPKTIKELIALLKKFDPVINFVNKDPDIKTCVSVYDASMEETIKNVNGINIDLDCGLILLCDFYYALKLNMTTNPDDLVVVETNFGNKYFVTDAIVEVCFFDSNNLDEGIFASIILYQ